MQLLTIERCHAGDVMPVTALFMTNFPLERSESVSLYPDFGSDKVEGK